MRQIHAVPGGDERVSTFPLLFLQKNCESEGRITQFYIHCNRFLKVFFSYSNIYEYFFLVLCFSQLQIYLAVFKFLKAMIT